MAHKKNRLFTIGYEGATAEQLIETLVNVGVEVLADVRELPLSRKRGLSKTALSERANEAGIEYIHFRELGDPKAGREAARAGNFGEFEKIFDNHLASASSQNSLGDLISVAQEKVTCMLCFEKSPVHCHRSIIAESAEKAGIQVYDLMADRPEKYLENDITIPRHRSRKSLSTTE